MSLLLFTMFVKVGACFDMYSFHNVFEDSHYFFYLLLEFCFLILENLYCFVLVELA